MKTAALYVRVSTEEQATAGTSLATQEAASGPVWHPSTDDIGTLIAAMRAASGLMAAA